MLLAILRCRIEFLVLAAGRGRRDGVPAAADEGLGKRDGTRLGVAPASAAEDVLALCRVPKISLSSDGAALLDLVFRVMVRRKRRGVATRGRLGVFDWHGNVLNLGG